MLLPRSRLPELSSRPFIWATGIEDTFITAPWPASGRTLDEYELTGHYARQREDIGLIAELGVPSARYGIPWHRVNPRPGRWDWRVADRALEQMLRLGIDPIIDLVHYGTPPWLAGAFLNPDYPQHVAEYAARLAERFKGRIRWYTPLNEPRITAWYCGQLGWWPPFRRGWSGFVAVMLALCRGIVETCRALLDVDREIVFVHVDATDEYTASEASLEGDARRRQQIVFLALDLVSGKVGKRHPLWGWLLAHGAAAAELERFQGQAVPLDVVGMNLYPMFSQKQLVRTASGVRARMTYAPGDLVERVATLYWRHYRRPLMITETASAGSVARRRRWLDDSVQVCERTRARGVPLVGYTWWPLFALVAWAYRQSRLPPERYLVQMGLWNLDEQLTRVRTPMVDAYREIVAERTLGCTV